MEFLSRDNKFDLNPHIVEPEQIKGIVLCLHDMMEHQERYYGFLDYLAKNGFVACVYDHRGHGKNLTIDSLGYFNDTSGKQIVYDVDVMVDYLQMKYPEKPVYLFAQGMGATIAKIYLQENDFKLKKVILAGSPSYNPLIKANLAAARGIARVDYRGHARVLRELFMGKYFRAFTKKDSNAWLSKNTQNVADYDNDQFCGFEFTNNGYLNLAKLMINANNAKKYKRKKIDLKILFIAGSKDPVINGIKDFNDQLDFLERLGYNVTSKLYGDCRHEILNENIKQSVYQEIVDFFNK